jgi:hypothetical protein
MGEIEHGGRAGDLPEHQGVSPARGFQVCRFDRHRMNLLGLERAMREQTLAQVGEVPVGVSGRRHPLVDLDDMHTGPWHLFIGQCTQHRPGSVTPADGHDETTTRADRGARLRGRECGTRPRDRIGIGQRLDLHGDLTVGFCQPPRGETAESTSFGPQVPGSYS